MGLINLISIIILLSILFVAAGLYIFMLRRKISHLVSCVNEMDEHNQQIELALHACKVFPWIYLPNGCVLSYLSKSRSKLYTDDLSIEYFAKTYVDAEYREMLLEALDKTSQEKGAPLNLRIKMRLADWEKSEWVHVAGIAVGWDDVNKKTVRLVGVIRYITKEVEQEKELKDNKEFLELTLRTANIIPWEYLLDKDILISKAPSRSELAKPILMSEYGKHIVHPDFRAGHAHEVKSLKEGKRGDYMDYKMKVLNKSGEYEWVRVVGAVISKDENGKPLRMIGSAYQIDQEIKREEQVNSLRNAEEANRLKTAFLANISHEIRTPLNAIVGFSQLIMESPESSSEFLPIINENTQLLLKLISDILDISRIESGDMHMELNSIDLNDLMGNARSMYACGLPPGIDIRTELPAETFILQTDKSCLMQVMHNLLGNAVKFTKEGSIVLGYSLDKDQYVRIFVRDTGVGIDQKHHTYIFERFSKIDSFVQGAGLGLAICKMIIKLLGGQIGVTSDLCKGSEFWFTIPIKSNIPVKDA